MRLPQVKRKARVSLPVRAAGPGSCAASARYRRQRRPLSRCRISRGRISNCHQARKHLLSWGTTTDRFQPRGLPARDDLAGTSAARHQRRVGGNKLSLVKGTRRTRAAVLAAAFGQDVGGGRILVRQKLKQNDLENCEPRPALVFLFAVANAPTMLAT